MKKNILLILLLIISYSVKSQSDFKNGFIVNLKGDTIYGLVDYRGDTKSSKICSFKNKEKSDVEKYLPNQISGYGFIGGKNYTSMYIDDLDDNALKLNENNIFLEYLIKGYVSLYYFRDDNQDNYFIHSTNNGLKALKVETYVTKNELKQDVIITKKEYLGVLSFYLQNCDSVSHKIPKTNLDHFELTNLIKEYNDCICYECILFVKPKPFTKSSFGTTFGLNNSTFCADYNYLVNDFILYNFSNEKVTSLKGFNAGLFYNLVLPRINEKISVQPEICLAYNSFSNYSKNANIEANLNFDLYTLKLPFSLKYTYSAGKIKPYFFAGVVYNRFYFKNSVVNISIYSNYYNTYTYKNKTDFFENQSKTNIFAGTGILLKLSENLHLILDFKYEFGKNIFSGNTSNFYFLTGINFL